MEGGGGGRKRRKEEGGEHAWDSPVQGMVLEAEMNSMNGQGWTCKDSGLRRKRRRDPRCENCS